MRLVRWLVGWVPLDSRGRRATGEVLADWHHEAALTVSGLTRFGVAVRALAALARTLAFVTVVERLPGTGGAGSRPPGTGDARGRTSVLGAVPQDLRYAVRTLANAPAFTAVVVLSLGLGIGATSTIFSAINPLLLRPLPFADPERLVMIEEFNPQERNPNRMPSVSTYLEWRDNVAAFEELEWLEGPIRSQTYPGTNGPERYSVKNVSLGLFRSLGVEPILGRSLMAEDAKVDGLGNGAPGGILLSHDLWQRRFAGDPNVLGQTLGSQVVVGVLPPGSDSFFHYKFDIWGTWTEDRGDARWMLPIGRLKPGVSMEQAQAQLDAIARNLDQSGVSADNGWRVRVLPLQGRLARNFKSNLSLLMGAAGLLLLIACSNVANLLAGRATNRRREMTTRAALGAGRLRLMRQMLTESVVLALLGGALGVLMAQVGTRLFVTLAPTAWFVPAGETHVDATVLGFTLGLSLLTVVLFGMVPALRASRPDLTRSLKEGGGGSAGGSRPLVHKLLVGSQVALTFVLLANAALMINSLVRLLTADRGFDPAGLVTAHIMWSVSDSERYVTREVKDDRQISVLSPEVDLFFREVLEGLRALPGVEAAEATTLGRKDFTILPDPGLPPDERRPRAAHQSVSPGYFAALGVPLLKGRSFTERDAESSPWVAVIDETLARRHFPDEDPIGRFLLVGQDNPREIVGIVGDSHLFDPRGPREPGIFVPHTQHLTEYNGNAARGQVPRLLFLKTSLDPASMAADVRRIVAAVDPGVYVGRFSTMREWVSGQSFAPLRFWMRTLGIFATLALVLATVGVYGVVAYAVAQRTHEIGVRMALGAQRADVLRMVIRQGMIMTAAGVIVGVLGAVAATRLLQSWLFEIEATDPATFATVAVVLVGIALLATWVPARGATRVDPVNTMRGE